ncbi:MAG: alpha/beta hydrolase [Microbacterium sp.]
MTTATLQTFEPSEPDAPRGRTIGYIDEGTGPALVLIPETGQDVSSLGTLASILVEEDFRVLRLGALDPATDVHALARTVVDVMDAVGLDNAWIGGHGFGGTVARAVPQSDPDHHDRVNGILLLAPEPADIPLAADIPVLVIHGTDDEVTPLSESERLVASAPAIASLKTVEGAGHLFPATHPGEASWFIEDYLDWD